MKILEKKREEKNAVTTIVEGAGSTLMSAALANAGQLKVKKNGGNGNGGNGNGAHKEVALPDLNLFSVQEKTPEEMAAEKAAAEEKALWCKTAAPVLLAIRRRISEIKFVAQHGPLGVNLAKELDELLKRENTLMNAGGDPSVARHLDFSVFIEQIRSAPQDSFNAEFLLKEAVKRGRYSVLLEHEAEKKKKEWRAVGTSPIGVLFFAGKVYVPFAPAEGETKSKGQMALESVLGQLLRAVSKNTKDNIKDEIAKIKSENTAPFSGLKRGEAGLYLIHFPSRVEKGGKKWLEGAGLLRIVTKVVKEHNFPAIEVIDGAGSLKWLSSHKGQWIPYSRLRTGIKDSDTGEQREFAQKLIKAVNAAILNTK